ncbi:MAG: glycoside hydrolase family 88 protein [Clostridia bacterium]|nr:glycoside hydrolase family 88 protein [Clostridia bacterium]
MKKILAILTCTAMVAALLPAVSIAADPTIMPREEVVRYIELVNDYWISTHRTSYGSSFWERGAYNTGNIEAYMLTGIEAYREYSEAWAEANQWMGNRNNGDKSRWTWGYTGDVNSTGALFGDWQTCFQTFADLYNFDVVKDERKIARAREVMEYQMSKPNDDFWWWADGLYMVMPVMSKLYLITGNELYLDKLYEYFKYNIELMYDGEGGIPTSADGYTTSASLKTGANYADPNNYTNLFYRDANYVYPRNPLPGDNATMKNFWSRGGGWVLAALAKVLQDTPDSWEHRETFLRIYKDMAAAIAACQKVDADGNGFWTQSVLVHDYSVADYNPEGYETSGTAFYTYGILWGINAGILDRETFLLPALRGWKYLTDIAIDDSGKVGYVQWVGGEAGRAAVADNTQDFAVGATLLAGCEMARLSGGMEGNFYPYLQKRMVGTVSMKVDSPYMYTKNQIIQLDSANAAVKAVVKNDRTLVPVRVISEQFGANVTWDEATQTVTADDIVMQIGSAEYTVGGEAKTLEVAPEIIEGRTFIPLRAMAEALGKEVYYNDAEKLIVIGHKQNVFYECEGNMVKMLSDMLANGTIPEKSVVEKDFTPNIPAFRDSAFIKRVGITATAEPESFNNKGMAIDGDMNTRWASNVRASSITVDIGEVKRISKVAICFWKYDTRVTTFDLEVSSDNVTFTKVFSGTSLANTEWNVMDVNQDARYIRMTGFQNSENEWINVMELIPYGEGCALETNLK